MLDKKAAGIQSKKVAMCVYKVRGGRTIEIHVIGLKRDFRTTSVWRLRSTAMTED
jgi:hypothetical protein